MRCTIVAVIFDVNWCSATTSRKLDETRLELRQTEDRLLESDSARQRDHDAHVREQEAAVR